MRIPTGPAPTRQARITVDFESYDDADTAVRATIDHLVDELHQALWPLGVNPTITVEIS